MAFRRRRFKRRGVWLPTIGTAIQNPVTGRTYYDSSYDGVLDVGPAGYDIDNVNQPITFDIPVEDTIFLGQGVPTLSQFFAGGYALRRIVGKLFLSYIAPAEELGKPMGVRVAAGFMVRRVDQTGAASAASQERWPSNAENIRDPWIWRNTWDLGSCSCHWTPGLPTTDAGRAVMEFPSTNQSTFGQYNGPYFDIQTKRTVGNEERLFLDISTVNLELGFDAFAKGQLYWHLDLRAFAFPNKSTNRRNASR